MLVIWPCEDSTLDVKQFMTVLQYFRSLMQILLRLELSGRNLQTDEWIEDTAEEIISLLRLISLSHSPAVMSACLKNICVEK